MCGGLASIAVLGVFVDAAPGKTKNTSRMCGGCEAVFFGPSGSRTFCCPF